MTNAPALNANDEALRIWTTLPVKSWKAELAKLPERKAICGIVWPYRESVRERLKLAYKLWETNSVAAYLGMSARNKFADADGSQPESHEADERH